MTQDDVLRVVSVSGGKDSTALYAWAIDQFGKDGFLAVFADTGHEHPVTYNYVRNLPEMAGGPSIAWVKADLRDKVAAKGKEPSGNPFLDMMLWKGRAPSSKAQFCTEIVKLQPIKAWLETVRGDKEVIMYTGIRAGESERRSKMPEQEYNELFDCEAVRPLLRWNEAQVFDYLKSKGIPPNPLYEHGFGRVGCFPCIHAKKSELAKLPEWAWQKLEEWENKVGRTWFGYGSIPLEPSKQTELAQAMRNADLPEVERLKNLYSPSIADAREWAKTARGGRQFDMFAGDEKDVPGCVSTWSACE